MQIEISNLQLTAYCEVVLTIPQFPGGAYE
jgi:hypothetical protein